MQVELVDITKDYGSRQGVFDVSLAMSSGIMGMLGANGAGKTTIMSMVAGIFQPDSGMITVDGRNLWDAGNYEKIRRAIGYLPSDDFFEDNLSGEENLRYCSVLKLGMGKLSPYIHHLLEQFALTDSVHKKFHTYSMGMKRKIQLIASLIGDPAIILWDEPQNSLDIQSNIFVQDLLADLKLSGKTICISSHVLEYMQNVVDEIVVIHRGQAKPKINIDEIGDLKSYFLSSIK